MCRIFYKYLPQLRKEQCWSGTLQKHCTFLFHLAPQLFQAPDGLLKLFLTPQFSSVAQSCPTLVTPWTAARQASLSITSLQSLLELMSFELVMPSNHLILSSPSPPTFNLSQDQGLFR